MIDIKENIELLKHLVVEINYNIKRIEREHTEELKESQHVRFSLDPEHAEVLITDSQRAQLASADKLKDLSDKLKQEALNLFDSFDSAFGEDAHKNYLAYQHNYKYNL